MGALLNRLRDAFRRRAIADEFAEEQAFHLAELERVQRERGASAEEARRVAARAFGNEARAREDLRLQAGIPAWDNLVHDLRHAARGLIRRPWLTGSVVAILVLGLGTAATVETLIDAVFVRPLPVTRPDELYAAVVSPPRPADLVSRGTVRRLEAALAPDSVAAYGGGSDGSVQIGAQPALRANMRLVNGRFFAALGVAAQAGRVLADADDEPGRPGNVAVASFAWARAHFGEAAAAVGQTVTVNRVPVAIVGVLPRRFREVAVGQLTDLWLPAGLQPRLRISGNRSEIGGLDRENDPDWNREERVSWLQLLVRVRPGEPVPDGALRRAWEVQRDDAVRAFDDPEDRQEFLHWTWRLIPAPGGQSRFRESFRRTGWLLGGVVGVMLLLVCTNVSGILLVRTMARHREIGVRLAMGAGTFRVLRLGFFEAAILALVGGAGGWFLASGLLPVAVRLLAPGQYLDTALGGRSVLAMRAIAVATAALSAAAPLAWISRVAPRAALSGHGGLGRAPIRIGRMLVVAQFAIAVIVVALATALGTGLRRLLDADPGFARDQVETALLNPADAGYDDQTVVPMMERLREAALGVPGVTAVGFSSNGILAGSRSSSGIFVRNPKARVLRGHYQHDSVSPGFLEVAGIPLLRGRGIREGDQAGTQRVVVVNAAFAREVFGDLDPIGQSFGFDAKPSKNDWTVIGVVADVRENGLLDPAPPFYYVPAAQWLDRGPGFVAVRFTGAEPALRQGLREAFARVEPGLVVSDWNSLRGRMVSDLRTPLVTARLEALFGGCALLLAASGVVGALGYLVILRQREIALRLAIGASPGMLLRGVLGDSVRLSALGCVAGIGAVLLMPLLPVVRAVLLERPGFGSALVAALVAVAAALAAGLIPARRAARIDPNLMLKAE